MITNKPLQATPTPSTATAMGPGTDSSNVLKNENL